MSTFIIHLLIPALAMMAVRFIPVRYVWAWIWVSLVPDVDYIGWILYVNHVVNVNLHRALFHNVWITFVIMGFGARAFVRFRRANPGLGLRGFLQTFGGAGWVLASFYHLSHIILDVSQGGVVPFWPVSNLNLYAFFELDVNTQTQHVTPVAGTEVTPGAPNVDPVYPWIDSEETAYIVLMLLSLLLNWYIGRRERSAAQTRRRIKAVLATPSEAGPAST